MIRSALSRRWLLIPILLSACRGSLSPLSNKIQVGREPYVVFVADGEDGLGDLYASAPTGGTAWQITFTRVDEGLPTLSRDGTVLAFIRSRAPGDDRDHDLIVMNLLNGAERSVKLAGLPPTGLAWSTDGSRLYVRQGGELVATPAPPATLQPIPVPEAERAAADSALGVALGSPAVAMAVPCDSGGGICARFANGSRQTITPTGTNPVRWTGDSIGYEDGGEWVVRPLAGGRIRSITWGASIHHPRGLTVFGGAMPMP